MDECIKMYVDLLKRIHSTHVKKDDMPDMKEAGLNWVKFLKDYLEPSKYEKLFNLWGFRTLTIFHLSECGIL